MDHPMWQSMSSPHDYLAKRREEWDQLALADTDLDGLTDQQRAIVRQFEQTCIDSEFAELSEIVCNCTDKFEFATRYKELKAAGEQAIASPWPRPNPDLPPEANELIGQLASRVFEKKLYDTASWFWVKWDNRSTPVLEFRRAIEHCADPPGCRFRLFVIALCVLGLLWSVAAC
jgi:hypothetical protein